MPTDTGATPSNPRGTKRGYSPARTPVPSHPVTIKGKGYRQIAVESERRAGRKAKAKVRRKERKIRKAIGESNVRFRTAAFTDPESRLAERSFYTNPELLAEGNYRSLHKDLWKRIGLPGKRPRLKTVFGGSEAGERNAAAWVNDGENRIYVPVATMLQQQFGSKGAQDYDRLALSHEYAHTRQNKRAHRSHALAEGGAEEFSRRRGPAAYEAIGARRPKFRDSAEYGPLRRRVKRRGRRYALRGQFRPPTLSRKP